MADEVQSQDKSVPLSRFEEVINERNQLRTQIEDFKKHSEDSASKFKTEVDTIRNQFSELQLRHNETVLSHEMDKSLMSDGIDDETVVDYLKFAYNAKTKPEEGKERQPFGQWYQSFRESKPAILQPFLKTTEVQTEQASKSSTRQPTVRSSAESNGIVSGSKSNISNLTPQQILQMSKEEYAKYKDQIDAQIKVNGKRR